MSTEKHIWPAGCVIFFRDQYPPGMKSGDIPLIGQIQEQIPDARYYSLEGDLLRIYGDSDLFLNYYPLRIVNFRAVLIISALQTVGPSHVAN